MNFQTVQQNFLKEYNIQLDMAKHPNILQQKTGEFFKSMYDIVSQKNPDFIKEYFHPHWKNIDIFDEIIVNETPDYLLSKQDFDIFIKDMSISTYDLLVAMNNYCLDDYDYDNFSLFTPNGDVESYSHHLISNVCFKNGEKFNLDVSQMFLLAYSYVMSIQWVNDFKQFIQMYIEFDKKKVEQFWETGFINLTF